jgi:hypothetical protein
MYGLGAIQPCVTDVCAGTTYTGYLYDDQANQMVSDYRTDYDPAVAPLLGGKYWFRRGGRDPMCLNLSTPPGVCAATPMPIIPPVNLPTSPVPVAASTASFSISDVPWWGWVAGAGALVLVMGKH